MKIPLDKIHEASHQVRSSWTEEEMQELMTSMQNQGLVVPVKVRPLPNGEYELVYGHRRVEAARRLGWTEIDGFVVDRDDENALVDAVVENLQRHNMSQVAEGRAYKTLHDDYGLSYPQIASRVGKDQMWVHRLVALLEDEAWREIVGLDHDLSQQLPTDLGIKAQILRGAFPNDIDTRKAIARKVVKEGLSREQVKRLAREVAKQPNDYWRNVVIQESYGEKKIEPEEVVSKVVRRADNTKTEVELWGELPEAVELTRFDKDVRDRMHKIRAGFKIGKLPPEARNFLAAKIEKLAKYLMQFAKEVRDGAKSA